ncbi:hypothetical protein JCM17961_29490 [Endothiovibrio diazotrophicus]
MGHSIETPEWTQSVRKSGYDAERPNQKPLPPLVTTLRVVTVGRSTLCVVPDGALRRDAGVDAERPKSGYDAERHNQIL